MKNMRNRKANRHKNYNYSSSGYCFVTICTKNSISLFGKIENNKMILNEYGEIVKERWL
jgi:putative transposase